MKKIIFILFLVTNLFAQNNDPYKILNEVKEKFNRIEDYEVDVTIQVDVDFLKVPETQAKIYFKQPDKIRFKSEGFALLPKEGLNFSPGKLLDQDFDAIYIKNDTLRGYDVDVIKVIPSNPETEIILTSLWIDSTEKVFRKIETSTKRSGTYQIDMNYQDENKFGLPSEVKFSFNVGDIKIPRSISGEFDEDEEATKKKDKKMVGTVIVSYKNYKINEGISDNVFENEER